jgi:putative tricarboxylic transport membrane protein
MGRRDTAAGIVVLLIGVVFLVYNLNYTLGQLANPGPGVFPLMVGGVWVVLAVWHLASVLRKHKAPAREALQESKTKGRTKALFMIAALVFYLLIVKWAGFYVTTFLFVVICSKLAGAREWVRPLALSIGINLFCYLLFGMWLKLSFPKGIFF